MKTATVGDLRNSFPTVARWIEEGECVEITRSGKPFARLAPIPQGARETVEMPDFLGRMTARFPDEKPTLQKPVVDYDRGDR